MKTSSVLTALVLLAVLTLITDPVLAFSKGDRVQSTQNLNVRASASTGASVITTETLGSPGTIVDGPQPGNAYTWWYINWDNGYSGWSVQDYLTLITSTPTISSIFPVTGANFAQTITVNGSGFASPAQVKLSWPAVGIAAAGSATLPATFISSSQLQISATFGNDPATWAAQEINPGSVLSLPYSFGLQAPFPVITSLSPSSATAGGAGFSMTVNGSTFNQSSVVQWNGVNLSTTPTVDSGGLTRSLTAQVPAADIASSGTAQVTVYNPSPGGGTSSAATFSISGGMPSISGNRCELRPNNHR
jgi:hypothetical protein